MQYHFDVEHAQDFGVNEAIILNNLIFWLIKNNANDSNQYDGHTWTYNSLDAFAILFPFWNRDKIYRILKSLVKQGVIIKGNYNEKRYDKTAWYALKDETPLQICKKPIAEVQCGHCETATPIPYIKPDINNPLAVCKTADQRPKSENIKEDNTDPEITGNNGIADKYKTVQAILRSEFGKNLHESDLPLLDDLFSKRAYPSTVNSELHKIAKKSGDQPDYPVAYVHSYMKNWSKIKTVKENKRDIEVKKKFCPDCGKLYVATCCQACGWSI